MTSIDDFDRVLSAARAGDERAASVLYESIAPPLLRYLKWQEPRAADDLAAETWLALAQHIQRFEGDEGALRGWVFAVARRRLADHRRQAARRRTEPVTHEELSGMEIEPDPAEYALEKMAADQAVRELATGLSKDQAEVIVLRVLGGFSVEEVASILGKRPGTVRVLQHRALRRLAADTGLVSLLTREV